MVSSSTKNFKEGKKKKVGGDVGEFYRLKEMKDTRAWIPV